MFGDLLNKAKSALGNLFNPQPQRIVSPLPDQFSRYTLPQGFIGPVSSPGGSGIPKSSPSPQPVSPKRDTPVNQSDPFNIPGGVENISQISGIDELLSAIVDPVSKALESWQKRLEDFDRSNPFSFDEAQARASSEERLNPYYKATLDEFMTGIRRSSARSIEDSQRTIGELNADATKLSEQERLSTQEAIRQSEEGFAGAGLFFSGKRARATGLEEVQGGQALEGIETGRMRGLESTQRINSRTQEDLALQESRQKRLTDAERTTALETDVAKQKREASIRREQERVAFAGPAPGGANSFDLQNKLYGLY